MAYDMIGTCSYPYLSSPSRMLATMPSIMPLGATMSAPARAWLTETRARMSRVSSFST